MRFIDKDRQDYRVPGLQINRRILNSHWDGKRYVNLHYDVVDKTDLTRLLVEEQNGYCCYCMRRLHMQQDGHHRRNVTLEHVIPHKISQEEWEYDKEKYRKFPILVNNVKICHGGELDDPAVKFGMSPFPHFLSYDNLVASCDGQTVNQDGREIERHCCNNMRGNNYVEPLFFHQNVSDVIDYDNRGHVKCPEEYAPYLQEGNGRAKGVNIMSPFLNDVRLFWKQVADSEYSVADIHEAEDNEELRIDIIDDIFTIDPSGHWLFLYGHKAWCIFADYEWFYGHYANKQ